MDELRVPDKHAENNNVQLPHLLEAVEEALFQDIHWKCPKEPGKVLASGHEPGRAEQAVKAPRAEEQQVACELLVGAVACLEARQLENHHVPQRRCPKVSPLSLEVRLGAVEVVKVVEADEVVVKPVKPKDVPVNAGGTGSEH